MSQSGSFAWQPGSGHVQVSPPRASSSRRRARHRELKLKLAALQKDYADLHTALFEAAQVHRRLCAPRLVRHGDFEIASEIFAVRHLPGDFFTVEETSGGVILALGDICGKGLAAGMWTTYLVGLVRAHTAASSEPQAIVTGVNRDLCRMHRRRWPACSWHGSIRRPEGSITAAPDILPRCSCARTVSWNRFPKEECCSAWLPDASFTTGMCGTARRRRAAGLLRRHPRVAQQRRSGVRLRAPRGATAPRTSRLRRGRAVFSVGRRSGFRRSARPDRRHVTRRRRHSDDEGAVRPYLRASSQPVTK